MNAAIWPKDLHSGEHSCCVKSDCFACVLNLTDPKQSKGVQNLRHNYFVKHCGWVSCNGSGEETDHYDPFCQHLTVFQNDHIIAYMRLLPWRPTTGFMLEHDFACLLNDEERASLIHDHSAELSRLVIAPAALGKSSHAASKCDERHTLLIQPEPTILRDSATPLESVTADDMVSNGTEPMQFTPYVLELLLKLLYHVSRGQGISTYYIVVEPPLLKILRWKFGIPFKPIGKPYTFPDGTYTVAAITTLGKIEESIKRRWLHKYDWYQRIP